MSEVTAYVDFQNRKLTDETGGAFALPSPLIDADRLTMGLRGLRRTADGVRIVPLQLRALKASIASVVPQAPPAAGGAKLRFGGTLGDPETAEVVLFSATDEQLKTALTGVSGDWTPEEVVRAETACWLVRFVEQEGPSPLRVGTVNTLLPISFVRVRAFQRNGVWWHEVRFVQAPYTASTQFAELLPPAPTIKRIQEGGSDSVNDDIIVNEIQALVLPPTFRGTYVIKFDGRVSSILGLQDGPDEIAAALNGMWADGKERFRGTNPVADEANLEFIGDLGDTAQNLMETEVKTFEPGAPTFTLDLKKAEMSDALRIAAALDKATGLLLTKFELELTYVEEGEDVNDEEVSSRFLSIQLPLSIGREQNYEELETIAHVDYARPPAARDYIPFDPEAVITGQQHYTQVIGNGSAIEFEITHGLDTDDLAGPPTVRENTSGGRVLGYGTEYTATIDSANVVTLYFAVAPALNSLVVCITTAGPVSAFQAHHHSIGEVDGLEARLTAVEGRVTSLEALAPALTRAVEVDTGSTGARIVIDDIEEIFPAKRGVAIAASAAQKDSSLLPRPLALLRAIHDASAGTLTVPLVDPTGETGNVYTNSTGSAVLIPGAYGQRSFSLPNGGFVGSDGRLWYPLTRSGTSTSYYPTAFERELFILALSAQAWQPGQRFRVEFDLSLQMLRATTRAVYVLVIESGTAPAATSPSTTDPLNLSNVTWDATPLLAQRIVVTNNLLKHLFGARIKRSASNVLSADQLKYTAWSAADAVPSSTSFVLRARLIKFDVEDAVVAPRGFIYRHLEAATAVLE